MKRILSSEEMKMFREIVLKLFEKGIIKTSSKNSTIEFYSEKTSFNEIARDLGVRVPDLVRFNEYIQSSDIL
jgi:hypothetical protein